jgi:putative transposase
VAAGDIVPVPGAQFEETLASASPDMLRAMIREFAQRMMDADVEVACNAGYGEVTPDRVNSRNGYWRREWDTRAGTIELAIPKLRQGSYFPGFPEHRRALASVVATSYLLGVSTRRVEKLAASLGVVGLSKSQVSIMAGELDEVVDSFRNRPLDRGPYTFCWIDALTQKVREGGRTVNVHCLIAVGVNADGCREILGVDVTSSEDGAGWLAFLRGLAARGLSCVALVTSDDHAGLVNAIAAVLPGAAWQRCRTHYHRNLLTRVPKTAQPWVSTLVRTIFEQPDAASVRAQHGRRRAGGQAPGCRRAPGRRPRRDPGIHRLPPRGVAADLVEQPAGTAEQGGPAPHRRGRHLPRPRGHHPAGRRGARRAERRMDRIPPLYGPGNPRRVPESRPARHGTEHD